MAALAQPSGTDNEVSENDFAPQHVENPLELFSNHSNQKLHENDHEEPDEAPPPYSEFGEGIRGTQQVEVIERSSDNSPQVIATPQQDYSSSFTVSTPSTMLGSPSSQTFPSVSGTSINNDTHRLSTGSLPWTPPPTQPTHTMDTAHPHTKSREAGFELHQSPSLAPSTPSSVPQKMPPPSSTPPSNHISVPGNLPAFLIPFPTPRLKGLNPDSIPPRFLIYTPPLPPLSKPEPGQVESQWHKTQRLWQEDVRRAAMTNASRATWKGVKARTTAMVSKGVGMARSSTVEFLDRVAGVGEEVGGGGQTGGKLVGGEGRVSEVHELGGDGRVTGVHELGGEGRATEAHELGGEGRATKVHELADDSPAPKIYELAASSPSDIPERHTTTPSTVPTKPSPPNHPPSTSPPSPAPSGPSPSPTPSNTLPSLILLHPPSLPLTPPEIRKEFVASLFRTREQARNKALIASALLPLAATMDAMLVVTMGGFTQASGVVAYQNTRGAAASRRLSRALAGGGEDGGGHAGGECAGGHGEVGSSNSEGVPKTLDDAKGKATKKGVVQSMQTHVRSSTSLETFTRYLELACLQRSFAMFPHVRPPEPCDPTEEDVLDSIGWAPKRRSGRDLDVEADGETARLSAEQDEEWQRREAVADVAGIARKAAAEWVAACKGFRG